ncbi:MAG: aminoacetone oxidase family FAD-binding enzyme [Bacilli bacterium]|nr:aminoacetone oxidase family FAD-binding enzyme [Bacilli bacterium]
MRIVIVGAGPSGVISAILLKRKNPSFNVVILEQLDRPLKKVTATGNGKCNFANKGNINASTYSSIESLVTLSKYNFEKQIELLHSLNIYEKLNGDLAYPISESAQTVINSLLSECKRLGIEIITSVKVLDYEYRNNKYYIDTNVSKYDADKIIFAVGGKSSPKLGSDGSLFNTFVNHGYKVSPMLPGLCPIKTVEKTKVLDGTRVKAKVSLWDNKTPIYEENGEVLFKDHGLSGIVIFDLASIIARYNKKYTHIELDILPFIGEATLKEFMAQNGREKFLNAYLHPNMQKYVENVKDQYLASFVKHMPFTFNDFYGFEFSQVTVGGVSFDNVNNGFESTIEPNIYFVGEVMDNDGLCGGYNLMWAISSSMQLVDNIK